MNEAEKFTGEVVVVSLTKPTATIIYPPEAEGLNTSREQFINQFASIDPKKSLVQQLTACEEVLEKFSTTPDWNIECQKALDRGELSLADALEAITWWLNNQGLND